VRRIYVIVVYRNGEPEIKYSSSDLELALMRARKLLERGVPGVYIEPVYLADRGRVDGDDGAN